MLRKGKVLQKNARQEQKEVDIQWSLGPMWLLPEHLSGHFIPNQKQNLASISFCSSSF